MPWEAHLEIYLEVESILSAFFEAFDFCGPHCIGAERRRHPHRRPTGCCRDKYYQKNDLQHPAFDLLTCAREDRYGRPQAVFTAADLSNCEYHTPAGCRLKTHKSPTCLSFLCNEAIGELRERYRIFEYDYNGIYHALEWILTGDLKGQALEDFISSCRQMAAKLRQAKAPEVKA